MAQRGYGRIRHPFRAIQRRARGRRRRTRRLPDQAGVLARSGRRQRMLAGRGTSGGGAAAESAGAHLLAHLGAVDAALTAAEATLVSAAGEIDADPLNRRGTAELIARRARAVVETAVEESIRRTARALGPAPLSQDAQHAQRVADLTIYVRQSHAERDLEQLGRLAGGR